MSQPDQNTPAPDTITLEEFHTWVRGIMDRFCQRATEAQQMFADDLEGLKNHPQFKALEAKNEGVVAAILQSEMTRLAKALG